MSTEFAVRNGPLPHPPYRVPVLGDILGINPRTPVQDSTAMAGRLGTMFERSILGRRFVFASGADVVGELCDEKRFEKFLPPGVENLRDIGADGLFTAYNHEPNWQRAHDLLRPAFTAGAMRGYHEIMVDVADDLVRHWEGCARTGATTDVSSDMTKLTLETIGRTGFSYSFGSFARTEPHPFVSAMVGALTYNQRRAMLRVPAFAKPLFARSDRAYAQNKQYLADVLADVVRTRRRSTENFDDLLQIMMNAARDVDNPNALSEANIGYQILTFLIAGHETTSGALSFALYYLATHPEVFERARAEVDEVWGAGKPEFGQVPKLRYVRRVLDESLRLWPTVPAFGRGARAETTVGDGYRMAAGDWAIVLVTALHRDPVWGDRPGEFDPDNFLPDRIRARPAHVYKPFGTGERACIGRQFAIHEAVLVLGTILQRFDLHADPSYRLQVVERLTMMPTGFRVQPSTRH
ncbi:cytochrome P450 [Rhodococcus sp. 06-418-5]|uniref:cytochrome P450 n=1 Tax=unclassified Rhodococcus (in: high G+C Gram-positive bacteria) TaxID=192944 RepID=UPI000B9B37C0|nr:MULTISPECIES: cytochrome P450 [unclassified Rhodococcus (in: high G+C Gram-positive bacteria)]OZC73436.1 cytochrome P450 [Rhodococcus sp. 06-418-5]OZF31282.1 cytochrome P450 [Rhodococcus sp. 14-2496-1d]